MDDFEESEFSYSDKIDIHALDITTHMPTVASVACEHGFRGIVVHISRIEELTKLLNNSNSSILPIAAIDYPFGSLSSDIRAYSIMSAKERGAKEVEVVAPYHLLYKKDFTKIAEDLQNLVNTAQKADVGFKYVLDQNSGLLNDGIRTKLCRIMSAVKVPIVSTSLGYFDNLNIDHGDNILKMRNVKGKISCKIKTYIENLDISDIALYPRAGVDIMGLEWNKAPYLVHAYEEIVQNNQKPS